MGELPPGLSTVMTLAHEADPDHMIQFGVVRTDDPQAFAEAEPGRA